MTTKRTFVQQHDARLRRPEKSRYELPPKVRRAIDEVNEARVRGEPYTLEGLCRVLKDQFEIPISVVQLRRRVLDYVGRRSW